MIKSIAYSNDLMGFIFEFLYTVARPLANLRCALFVLNVKQSLLHWAGGPKLVLNWLKEESKREPQKVFLEWPRHGVDVLTHTHTQQENYEPLVCS